jgi:hypothetical protein
VLKVARPDLDLIQGIDLEFCPPDLKREIL